MDKCIQEKFCVYTFFEMHNLSKEIFSVELDAELDDDKYMNEENNIIVHTKPSIDSQVHRKVYSEAEFKEFELRLKYVWFHLKLYSIFQVLSRRLVETGFQGI